MSYKNKRHWTQMDDFEYRNQTTVYHGKVVTLAQARAMKSVESRKKNQEKKSSSNDTLVMSEILPDILKHIESTIKSTRTLKSFVAFYNNGKWQFGEDFTKLMEWYPDIHGAFVEYKNQYNKVNELKDELTELLKKHKCHNSFIGLANDFGFQMIILLEKLNVLADRISRNRITTHPNFYYKDIVRSSPDKKRLGLQHLLSNSLMTVSKTKNKLIELHHHLETAYKLLNF